MRNQGIVKVELAPCGVGLRIVMGFCLLEQGSRAVVRLLDPKRKTLGEKGIDCIFVGYAEHSKAYRFYVIEPNDSVFIDSIIESRDAIFDENRTDIKEMDINKDKAGQNRARDQKEREKTSPAMFLDFIGPAHNPLTGPGQLKLS
ncbi:hypothetical protein Tco_0878317 [Tanacetum coccineum]|uniref:Retroviral polymerase SH3-like domain-containing protein n=1 Tax=Tanacetum coccineum TaxID=301880 RepID=A0ABQ5BXM3_9ASTR